MKVFYVTPIVELEQIALGVYVCAILVRVISILIFSQQH